MSGTTEFDHVYELSAAEKPSHGVVSAVAEAGNLGPLGTGGGSDLPRLYEVIDPEALDALFDDGDGTDGSLDAVQFSFAGYRVLVSADRVVHLSVESEAVTVPDSI